MEYINELARIKSSLMARHNKRVFLTAKLLSETTKFKFSDRYRCSSFNSIQSCLYTPINWIDDVLEILVHKFSSSIYIHYRFIVTSRKGASNRKGTKNRIFYCVVWKGLTKVSLKSWQFRFCFISYLENYRSLTKS